MLYFLTKLLTTVLFSRFPTRKVSLKAYTYTLLCFFSYDSIIRLVQNLGIYTTQLSFIAYIYFPFLLQNTLLITMSLTPTTLEEESPTIIVLPKIGLQVPLINNFISLVIYLPIYGSSSQESFNGLQRLVNIQVYTTIISTLEPSLLYRAKATNIQSGTQLPSLSTLGFLAFEEVFEVVIDLTYFLRLSYLGSSSTFFVFSTFSVPSLNLTYFIVVPLITIYTQ